VLSLAVSKAANHPYWGRGSPIPLHFLTLQTAEGFRHDGWGALPGNSGVSLIT